MLALSPTATELPIRAEKLGVIVQARSPTVIAFGLTAVTAPVSRAEDVPVAVALVVPVVPPEDVVVTDEDELEVDGDCEDETEELDEVDDELEDDVEVEVIEPGLPGVPGVPETVTDPGLPAAPDEELPMEDAACSIAFNVPCRQRIAANCPEENPESETRGPSRHASWPTEIRSGPRAEILPVENCAVDRTWVALAAPVETSTATIATAAPRRIATKVCAPGSELSTYSPPTALIGGRDVLGHVTQSRRSQCAGLGTHEQLEGRTNGIVKGQPMRCAWWARRAML